MQYVKRYLRRAYKLNELIDCNRKELAELNELKTAVGGFDYSKERVQTSPSGDANYTKVIAKIVELEDVIKADIERLLALKLEIRNTISEIEDNEQRLLLQHRYLNFLTWEEICNEMNVSARTVHRIHADALSNLKVGTH